MMVITVFHHRTIERKVYLGKVMFSTVDSNFSSAYARGASTDTDMFRVAYEVVTGMCSVQLYRMSDSFNQGY